MKNLYKNLATSLIIVPLLFAGCVVEEFEQVVATFGPEFFRQVNEPAAGASGTPIPVILRFSRITSMDGFVVIEVESDSSVYGINYETSPPELVPGEISLFVPAGSTTASISVIPKGDGVFTGNQDLKFRIKRATSDIRSVAGRDYTFRIVESNLPSITLFNTVFTECIENFEVPPPFIEAHVAGSKTDRGWGCRTFGNSGPNAPGGNRPWAVQASAFGGQPGADDAWLILPPINADDWNFIVLKFELESFFSGSGTVAAYWSNDYKDEYTNDEIDANPNYYNDPLVNGTWTEIPDVATQLPPSGSRGFRDIIANASAAEGEKVFIAFRYFGASSSGSSSWTIDDLNILVE